ncbi:glycosyltransferase family 2 protein [Caenimonas koreensis]|uniref:Glycosyltransferase n=1 Tax=Caenimonas koreensis DSM 17982 TaxID=1121255 RepID=A0A844B612_9BURK|nr:glycosyltransferase family 2 protein [Caenimonas koreensis]MRD48622.1 glycosyltransferase [Caenimonas koreensis DSM 17982]
MNPAETIELTILMPCLNEARTVSRCIAQAQGYLDRSGVSGEVLVADNGSTDGSRDLATRAGARVVEVPERGYGAAITAGIAAARGRFVIMGDADESYDFSHLDDFVGSLRQGVDLVMGNRFRGGIAPGAMPFLHKYLGNPVLSFVGRLFFRVPIGDFHCGLRGFSREAIKGLGLITPGMEFASEMIAKAALAGLRIGEVPTTLRPDGRGRPSHLRTWRDGWRHLRFLLLYCPRWLFLYPGLALFLGGLAGTFVLQRGPFNIASFGFDIHSMLFMAGAVILGAQLVSLALLTTWTAVLSGIVPEPPWLRRSKGLVSLEFGIIASLTIITLGFVWSLALFFQWRGTGYGVLIPGQLMREAIPAVALMIVGAQGAATSFFAAALKACWESLGGALRRG